MEKKIKDDSPSKTLTKATGTVVLPMQVYYSIITVNLLLNLYQIKPAWVLNILSVNLIIAPLCR